MREKKLTYKRINIVGTSGSGKSTWGKKLAKKLNAPYVGLDELFWGPDWYETPDEPFFEKISSALNRDSWVLDGNYSRTIPLKWKNVEAVIWLDLPFYRNFYQAFTRAFNRAWTKKELWPGTGNHETFRKSFLSRDSIILWMLKSYGKMRKRYHDLIADPQYAHIDFIVVRSHREMEEVFDQLEIPAN